MAKLIWAIPCSRILLDQPSNLVSYIDALDGVAIPSFPADAPTTFIGTLWHRDGSAKIEVRIAVYDPDGKKLMDSEAVAFTFEPHHKRCRANIGFSGFPLKGPGQFSFGVELKKGGKWTEVLRIPFDVDQMIPAQSDELVH
jgi:hypothetical protein